MERPLSLLATLALATCATVSATTVSATAQFGQIAALGSLRVRPLQIMEDSRCPINARCVWAGRLTMRSAFQLRELTARCY